MATNQTITTEKGNPLSKWNIIYTIPTLMSALNLILQMFFFYVLKQRLGYKIFYTVFLARSFNMFGLVSVAYFLH